MRRVLLFLAISSLILSCTNSSKFPVYSPEFIKHISAYSSGVVNRDASILIMLAEPLEQKKMDKTDPEDLLEFSPRIKGSAVWVDSRTVKFTPEEELPRGTIYQGVFYLGEVKKVDRELRKFPFRFETRKQSIALQLNGIRTYPDNNPKFRYITGQINTNDKEERELVEKCLKAKYRGSNAKIKWLTNSDQTFNFRLDSIDRGEYQEQVVFSLSGDAIEADETDTRVVSISGMGVFGLENIEITHEPDQKVEVYFSENLNQLQSLLGLVKMDSLDLESFEVNGNKLTIFPKERISGEHTLSFTQNIKNYAGYRLKKPITRKVYFERTKPKLKMIGEGTIVPNAKGIVFPFEAMGLKAVDVWIYRIYEKNIAQFLQINDLDGNNQLSRVGKQVYKGKVDLNQNKKVEENKWTRYTLNINKYIKQEPGAIYRVLIGYRSSYTFFDCPEGRDYSLDDDGLYYEYYNGENSNLSRSTPCERRFYYGGSLCRNILASDVGLIVKKGNDGITHVFTSSLISAGPIQGAKVDFYSYQNRRINTVYTNMQGMAQIKLPEEPYLVTATVGQQKGYLKISGGRSNSTSKFDVGGVNGHSPIDGYIYTERGVWRPGDSIYTSFVLQDKNNTLPNNVPVKFELRNTRGQIVRNITRNTSVGGVYDFRTATEPNWQTGNYSAKVVVGNRSFYRSISVETVKPNRLKLRLNVKDSLIRVGETNQVTLSSEWLHGAPSPGLKYNVKGKITSVRTYFKNYSEYNFNDATKSATTKEMVLSEGNLDNTGKVEFAPNFYLNDRVKGSLKVNLIAKVFEKGGNFSQDYGTFPVQVFKSYVGIRTPRTLEHDNSLETDKKHIFKIANVDPSGKPLTSKRVSVKIYKVDWNWWWEHRHNMSSFMQSKSLFPVVDTVITTDNNGLGKAAFRLPYPNWGRFIMVARDEASQHTASQMFYVDWPYWRRGNRNKSEQAKTIVLTSDKQTYGVNQTVQVTIPSSASGRALVCIENGSSIMKKFWVTGSEKETRFQFQTTADMAPNVYVHVSYLQAYKDKENDLPARLYGILPIKVENRMSHLHPIVTVADEIRPDRDEIIRVKERNGRPMTYTLAVVDEGLLDLTHFKTPELWSHFYQKQRLGVRTWDLYDEVMGGYAGKYGNVLSVGGDESGARDESVHKANRFKPAVKFLGPFKLRPGQVAKHSVKMGEYIGAVRVMVVARQGQAYGSTDKSVKVRKPIMVLPTLPRVLSPGERIKIPVTVFSMTPGKRDVSVSLKSSENLRLTGDKSQKVTFDAMGDQTVFFEAIVAEKVGVANLKTTATSGTETAVKNIEIAIRTPNPRVYETEAFSVAKGQSLSETTSLAGMGGTNNCAVEVSSLPPLNMHSRLDELLQYPHGCVEQTTSSVFAQLFVDDILTLTEQQKFESEQNIQAAIRRLKLFQTSTGGLAYWPGNRYDNEWGTTYAGHFLLLAQQRGYKVEKRFIDQWLSYQKEKAKSYEGNVWYDDLTQAYRLYTLVLAGKPDVASMNRMRERSKLSGLARWRLAAAYARAGMVEVASSLVDELTLTDQDYSKGHGSTFGSSLRDKAMILETMHLLDMDDKSMRLVRQIANELSSKRWLSTQETAYSLIAVSDIYKENSQSNLTYTLSYDGNSKEVNTAKTVSLTRLRSKSDKGSVSIKVKNSSESLLYVRVLKSYVPLKTDSVALKRNLAMDVKYVDYSGNELDPKKLVQGQEFKAIVRVKNTSLNGRLKDMAMSFMVPVGWEIENTRMMNSGGGDYAYRDFRDDRVYTYFDMRANELKTFEFKLTASYSGEFFQPTLSTTNMYNNDIQATVPGGWVKIVSEAERTQ